MSDDEFLKITPCLFKGKKSAEKRRNWTRVSTFLFIIRESLKNIGHHKNEVSKEGVLWPPERGSENWGKGVCDACGAGGRWYSKNFMT